MGFVIDVFNAKTSSEATAPRSLPSRRNYLHKDLEPRVSVFLRNDNRHYESSEYIGAGSDLAEGLGSAHSMVEYKGATN
jgi:hypothetical protein